MSGPIVPVDQVASTNRLRGNGFSSPASTASNTDIGAAPPNAPALPTPCDLLAPHHGLFLYVLQGHEFPAPPERIPDIRHRAFHPRLLLQPTHPRQVQPRTGMLRHIR